MRALQSYFERQFVCVARSDDQTGLCLFHQCVSSISSVFFMVSLWNEWPRWFSVYQILPPRNEGARVPWSGHESCSMSVVCSQGPVWREVSAPHGHSGVQTQRIHHSVVTSPGTPGTQPALSSQREERAQEYRTQTVCFSLSHKFTRTCLLVANYRIDSSYYLWNTHISSSRPPLRDLFLLLWDNPIPFRHSNGLKSSNFWIQNSPYIRCEYSLSWSGNFDVKIQVICFPTLPLSFNTHTQYSSRKGKL